MKINHHDHSAVKPGRPGSELFPHSPLGEQVEEFLLDVMSHGSLWSIIDETVFLRLQSMAQLHGHMAMK